MAATVIGLDVGTNAVRAVELELGDPPLIRRMGQIGLPPGAVVDGEVADVAAVSIALRRLWTETAFHSRRARVGMSSARVIVRTIEMPKLSHDELMSTIRLQLDDYVPLAADETVFDVRSMNGPPSSGPTSELVLAATHQDAVQPLLMAMQGADLHVTAVDVIPQALARALTHPETDGDDDVDIVVSIGAGTVVVVAAHDGEPLFARTLTNACGRRTTERIANRLGVGEADAERYKRQGATEDATSAVALQVSAESVDELTEEIRASLAFYGEQPSARHVRRLVLTGGGSLLPGLPTAVSDDLGIDVELADPFRGLRLGRTGFEPCDLPHLAPYMAAAIGVALAANRPKDQRIDLTPVTRRSGRRVGTRRISAGLGAAMLVAAGGWYYVDTRAEVAAGRDRVVAARAQLADLQTQISRRSPTSIDDAPTATSADAGAVLASVAATDLDWVAVQHAVEAAGAPLGVIVSSLQGVVELDGTPSEPASLTLTATAPDVPTVADWLDSIAADPRFAEPWVGGVTMIPGDGGSTVAQFTVQMIVTDANLVVRGPGKGGAG